MVLLVAAIVVLKIVLVHNCVYIFRYMVFSNIINHLPPCYPLSIGICPPPIWEPIVVKKNLPGNFAFCYGQIVPICSFWVSNEEPSTLHFFLEK